MIKKSLSDISISISSGLTPLRSNNEFWSNGTIPWLKTEQLGKKYIFETNEHISKIALEKTSIRLFPKNTISIAMYGEGKTRGNLSILKKPMATNQACCNIIIDPEKADFEYVYYFLKTQYEELRNLSSGVRKNLNSNDIKSYIIRMPEKVVEQISIRNILKKLDQKIEVNNRINSELKAMAKTLYDYWFVQFDFPDENGKPYKSSGGKMVYNSTLKREIPEGWEVKAIKEISKLKAGGDKPADCSYEKTESQIIPIYSNGLVDDGLYGFTSNAVIHQPSITISARGTIGFSKLRLHPFTPIIRLIVLTPNDSDDLIFMDQLIKWIDFENSGSVQQQLTVPQISGHYVLYPPKKYRKEISKKLLASIEKIETLKKQNEELENLRDWLLPMLMNGQVTVTTKTKSENHPQNQAENSAVS